ncbi:MAG TPA: helix-turn-helix transcriptional regulator [Ktedonobacteraceae bacterium]|nr:helix-turn-helix transcriptional regulator [Ktedonobacteraceae bacterium]
MSLEKRFTEIVAFGERLVRARTDLKFSQKALAEIVGTTARSISRWEHNQAIPQPYYLERICKALQISPETFSDVNETKQHRNKEGEKILQIKSRRYILPGPF